MRTALVGTPIDVAAVTAEVTAVSNGAVSVFVGTVRDVNDGRAVDGIEYNAYAPMAEREMAAIAQEASAKFDTPHIVIEHRTGYLALGGISVIIAVGSPHRAAAMDASRWIIEALKARVPIWKREHYTDGARAWVNASTEGGRVQGGEGGRGQAREGGAHA